MPSVTRTRRILFVTGLVAGGIGAHVQQLTTGLRAAGQQVCVAAPTSVLNQFDLAGFANTELPFEVGSRPSLAKDRKALIALTDQMRDQDVVHAHGVRAGALAVLARRRLQTHEGGHLPVLVVTLHNAAPEKGASRLIHQQLQRVVARGADLVLAVSPDLQAEMVRFQAKRTALAVVPANPPPSSEDVPATQSIRQELGVSADEILLVTAARLTAQKGLPRLLEAVAQVTSNAPGLKAKWVVAGDGPDRARLQTRIQEHGLPITLLGHRGDLPALLAAADVAVSTARWEGQPVWMQEALQAGCAIIATDVGGTDTVLDGAGWLVPGEGERVVSGLVEAMTQLIDDADQRAVWSQRSVIRAAELPTVDEALAAILGAYDSVGGASGPEVA